MEPLRSIHIHTKIDTFRVKAWTTMECEVNHLEAVLVEGELHRDSCLPARNQVDKTQAVLPMPIIASKSPGPAIQWKVLAAKRLELSSGSRKQAIDQPLPLLDPLLINRIHGVEPMIQRLLNDKKQSYPKSERAAFAALALRFLVRSLGWQVTLLHHLTQERVQLKPVVNQVAATKLAGSDEVIDLVFVHTKLEQKVSRKLCALAQELHTRNLRDAKLSRNRIDVGVHITAPCWQDWRCIIQPLDSGWSETFGGG